MSTARVVAPESTSIVHEAANPLNHNRKSNLEYFSSNAEVGNISRSVLLV